MNSPFTNVRVALAPHAARRKYAERASTAAPCIPQAEDWPRTARVYRRLDAQRGKLTNERYHVCWLLRIRSVAARPLVIVPCVPVRRSRRGGLALAIPLTQRISCGAC